MTDHRHLTIPLGYMMWIDDVVRKRRRVAVPSVDVRRPSYKRRLIKYLEIVVFGHQLAESVNVAAIHGVDEADNRGDRRQGILTHATQIAP